MHISAFVKRKISHQGTKFIEDCRLKIENLRTAFGISFHLLNLQLPYSLGAADALAKRGNGERKQKIKDKNYK